MLWHISTILTLRKVGQEDHEFKVSLGYTESSRRHGLYNSSQKHRKKEKSPIHCQFNSNTLRGEKNTFVVSLKRHKSKGKFL